MQDAPQCQSNSTCHECRRHARYKNKSLHDLVLCHASRIFLTLHRVTRVLIFDESQAEWASAVLVPRKFCCKLVKTSSKRPSLSRLRTNSCLGVFTRVELDHTGTSGAAVGLVLDLGTLDRTNGGEELYQIFVACGPWKLYV